MSQSIEAMNEELLDLLTERALGELSPENQRRLDELLENSGLEGGDDLDLAAAAAMNAFGKADGRADAAAVPDGLKQKLMADAEGYFSEATGSRVSDIETVRASKTAANRNSRSRALTSRFGPLGWAVAATLAVFVVLAYRPDAGQDAMDPATARAALIEQRETVVVEWNSSDIPAYTGVRGDVVWNDERQAGFLRLAGMPPNDPQISQYQLWIVDPERDANPVDGGVFDVPRGSDEVIIPINAKLGVSRPTAFAVTREQPGGVVVSDGPLLIVAASS